MTNKTHEPFLYTLNSFSSVYLELGEKMLTRPTYVSYQRSNLLRRLFSWRLRWSPSVQPRVVCRCYLMPLQRLFLYSRPPFSSEVVCFSCLPSDPNLLLQSNPSPKFKWGTTGYFSAKESEGEPNESKARKWNLQYKRSLQSPLVGQMLSRVCLLRVKSEHNTDLPDRVGHTGDFQTLPGWKKRTRTLCLEDSCWKWLNAPFPVWWIAWGGAD